MVDSVCSICGKDRITGCTCSSNDSTTLDVVDQEVVEGEVVDDDGDDRDDDQHDPHHVDDSMRIVPPPSNPVAVAKHWMNEHHTDAEGRFLVRRHRNTFFEYIGTCWIEIEDAKLASELYGYLSSALYLKLGVPTPFEPTSRKMRDLVEALGALVFLDGSITPPAWIGDDGPSVVPVLNGLLDLKGRTLHPHSPAFFAHHVLPFEYDPSATSARWAEFVQELWPEDPSSIDALQEIMGYLIAGGTEQQKIFGFVGPKRSGKGTIGRVLTGLLGAHNVAAPTLSALATNFGMSPLIGRPLALISDARLGSRSDTSVAVERLLSVSGEDSITIDRKYREPWTGRLSARFLIMTNEIPRFVDAAGALASRFVMLVMTNSFYGREDPTLTDKLLAEAAGILNWALDGIDRLNERGYFEQPSSARDALRRLEDLSSPVSAFVRDRCTIGAGRQVRKEDLWRAWKSWCIDEGRSTPGTKAVFARDLHAAYPTVREVRHRIEGSETRDRVLEGIGLGEPDDPDDDRRGDDGLEARHPEPTPGATARLGEPDDAGRPVSAEPRLDLGLGTGTEVALEQTRLDPDAPPEGGSSRRRWQGPRPTLTQDPVGQVGQAGPGSPTSSSPDGTPAHGPLNGSLVAGTIVRQFGGSKSKQFRVRAVNGTNVDCWELEHGQAGKLYTFNPNDLVIVEAAPSDGARKEQHGEADD